MRRSLIQIGQLILMLMIVLSFPLFIQAIKTGDVKKPEITTSSAQTSNVLGASTTNTNATKIENDFDIHSLKKYALYTLAGLFIISLLSFGAYKLKKQQKNYEK